MTRANKFSEKIHVAFPTQALWAACSFGYVSNPPTFSLTTQFKIKLNSSSYHKEENVVNEELIFLLVVEELAAVIEVVIA